MVRHSFPIAHDCGYSSVSCRAMYKITCFSKHSACREISEIKKSWICFPCFCLYIQGLRLAITIITLVTCDSSPRLLCSKGLLGELDFQCVLAIPKSNDLHINAILENVEVCLELRRENFR